jgi:hypothetical protein
MPTYNLDPGEFVVLQQSGVWLLTDDGQDHLDELVLTNTHLILVATVSEGLFHSSRYLKRLPLEETLDDAGRPRVFVGKRRDKSVLSVSFATDSISLVFGDGSITAAKRWAESISSAAVGDLDGVDTSDGSMDALGDFTDQVKGMIDSSLGTSLRKKPNKEHSKPAVEGPHVITARCIGCHAPLVGRKGQIVTCSYCDTRQTL